MTQSLIDFILLNLIHVLLLIALYKHIISPQGAKDSAVPTESRDAHPSEQFYKPPKINFSNFPKLSIPLSGNCLKKTQFNPIFEKISKL